MAATLYNTADILVKSAIWNIDVIPQQLRNTHRAFIKYAHADYSSDVDLTFTVFIKPVWTNTERSYIYTMSKLKTYFKQRLPLGAIAREWRFEISGSAASILDITEGGLLWIPVPIGGH